MRTTCYFNRLSIILLCWMFPLYLGAQPFSDWSVYPNLKTFKARFYQFKATDGYSYIRLEVTSSVPCSMQITSTLCGRDNQDRNGWKRLVLRGGEYKTLYFKIFNSCRDGWWWWYRYYKEARVIFDE